MPLLADRQRAFAAALFDPALAVPAGLVGPDREPCAKRFAVYRNNVAVGLINALQAAYPAVDRLVGDEFFRAMARAYTLTEQRTSPILLDYGAGFANFIAGFEPAAPLPYLPDVARIERAWTEAYHARDAVALEPAALAAIPGDRITGVRFDLHPSVRFVSSQFPAFTIWRMNVEGGEPAPVDLASGGEDVLLARPDADVEVRSMPPGGAKFVSVLMSGKPLAEAAEAALGVDEHFDLSASLEALIGQGFITGYGFGEGPSGST